MRSFMLSLALVFASCVLPFSHAQKLTWKGTFTLFLTDRGGEAVFPVPNDGLQSNVFLLHIPSARSYSHPVSGEKGPHFIDLESGAYYFEARIMDFGYAFPIDPRQKRERHTREFAGIFWLDDGEQKVQTESWSSLPFYRQLASGANSTVLQDEAFYHAHAQGICGRVTSFQVSTAAQAVHFNILDANAAASLTRSYSLHSEAEAALNRQANAIKEKLSPRGRTLFSDALNSSPERATELIDSVFGTGQICLNNAYYGQDTQACRNDRAQFGRFSSPVRNLLSMMGSYKTRFQDYEVNAARIRAACAAVPPPEPEISEGEILIEPTPLGE